ncbi:hypothetical protein HO173_009230 [Letharia columbiana]|uniref:Macro domain-containing protein n=1 Tax=Letharia columbiana TaxID=112416 RepID=A0A8H6FPW4_9LECA|nr:uncharacterized protein HO173_009230 [Letharia columbiana]KAF6232562.1 hypothetical protein HO173_009230 [Letharia columbiana]
MAPPVQLSQIPTLSDLYKNGTLQPSTPDPTDTPLPTPSATLNAKVSLIRTSITNLATTCIVNAANTSLLGGGGVDGAIHSAAGPSLLSECRLLNGCPTGSAKITSAHALPSSYIIHAVGPIYHRHRKAADKLRSCYRTSLELALEKGKEEGQDASIAFSCLSTGVYGYPSGEAAEVAGREVRRFLEELEEGREKEGGLERVVFCIFEAKDERAYGEWLPKIFPPTPEDLSAKEEPAESESLPAKPAAEEAPAVSKDTSTGAPQARKLKTSTEDLGKDDWEAVEKPNEATSDEAADMSEEGEKVEAVEFGGSDGEKVGKSIEEQKGESKTDAVQSENMLAKDW